MTSPQTASPAGAPPRCATAAGRAEAAWMVAAVALAVVHFAWVRWHFAPAIMSPDANGYVVQARLIATEGRTSFSPGSPVQFVGMHWLETKDGVFHSRYPAGLPLLMALAWKLGGLAAALMINPLLASATVLLVFFLARPLAGHACALLAAAVVAAIPVTNQHALDADAHIAATFFLVAGVIALRGFVARLGVARRVSAGNPVAPAVGHDGRRRASVAIGVLAGALLGVVPTIRYPEAIGGVVIAAWLAWRVRPVWRAWPAVAGAALPIGALGVHNAAAYGAFWRTGYALTHEQTGFGFGYFWSHALPYLQALTAQGPMLFFAFGVAGLAALAVDRRRRSDGLLFAGIVVPLVLLYMAYYFGGGPGGGGAGAVGGAMGGNLRFLIPTFPFFATGGAWLLSTLARNFGAAGRVAVGVVAALQLLLTVPASQQLLARSQSSLTAAARARLAAEKDIPAGSIVIVDRALAESIDAVGAWRLVEEGIVGGMGPRGGPGMGRRPPGPGGGPLEDGDARPSPQQPGKNRAQQARYASLSAAERHTRVWADLAMWAGDRPVYWFTRSPDLVDRALPSSADYKSIAEIEAPALGFGPGGPGPALGGGGSGGRGLGGPGRGVRGGGFAPRPMDGPRGGMGFGPPGAGEFSDEAGGGGAKLRLVKISLGKM